MVRKLASRQCSQVWIHDAAAHRSELIFETHDVLLEAPNWSPSGDGLILNGDGLLWRLDLTGLQLEPIAITNVPPLNNDHVPAPDGKHIFISAYDDWHIYRAPLAGGRAERITGNKTPDGMRHFLHGVSPDGAELAFVGVQVDQASDPPRMLMAEIFTIDASGENCRQMTDGGVPADGPEYSPDGQWIYFNTEVFSGHAQIARMRRDGSGMTRLTHSSTVDWFPHISPDGLSAVYLAYPAGTRGHPADLDVSLMLVSGDDWSRPQVAVNLFGGQGTINVNSWSPDSRRFAYVAYPAR